MTDIQKPLPHNIDLEQAILGAVLVNNNCFDLVSKVIQPHHFFEPLHGKVFEVIGKMVSVGRKADPKTVKSYLPEGERVGEITLGEYLVRLAVEAVAPVQARDYATGVLHHWIDRQIISGCEETISGVYARSPDMDPFSASGALEDRLAKLRGEHIGGGSGNLGHQYLEAMTAAQQRQSIAGVPICLDEIAEVISEPCFEAGNLYGLLSSSGEGKTSLTLQMITHALKRGHPVLFMSYDQSGEQCVRQMIAQEHDIEARRQRAGDISEKEMKKAVDFATWIDRQPFEVVKCTNQTAPQLLSFARAFVKRFANGKVPLIVIDHIRVITPEDSRADPGTKALGIGQILKVGAEMTGSAFLVLNQRNTSGMTRDNPRPIASDLFGGEGAVTPFDAIFYVYRYKKFYEKRKDIAATDADWKKIHKVFPAAVIEGEDIAQIGAVKVRFGDAAIKNNLIFEARFTRYKSERQNDAELQEAML
ncbi:replicative DNA helicase [Nitratireductor aquimarinus]|uniref:replicative DNA helicase n=1 Tax=Nitratireductor aquimarinus TaxID=889300 RepID=UPI003B5A9D93